MPVGVAVTLASSTAGGGGLHVAGPGGSLRRGIEGGAMPGGNPMEVAPCPAVVSLIAAWECSATATVLKPRPTGSGFEDVWVLFLLTAAASWCPALPAAGPATQAAWP